MKWLMDIGGALFGGVTAIVQGWQQRKTAQVQADIELKKAETEARIARLKTAQDAEIEWDQTALETAGWKDELLLIVFLIPVVMCFVPGWDGYVHKGFEALAKTPDWFQYSLGLMVAASYGYRKFADWFMRRGSKE
jgi:hypothetical protein